MNKFLAASLFLISTNVFSECEFDSSAFSYESGSEYLYTIYLAKDGKLTFHHEYWAAGGFKEAALDEYIGTWSCNEGGIVITYSGYTDNATYKKIGENPIGYEPSLMSLHFEPSDSSLGSLILTEFDY